MPGLGGRCHVAVPPCVVRYLTTRRTGESTRGLSFASCRSHRTGLPPRRQTVPPSATGSPGCCSRIFRPATIGSPKPYRSVRTAGGGGSWSPGSASIAAGASWTWRRAPPPSRRPAARRTGATSSGLDQSEEMLPDRRCRVRAPRPGGLDPLRPRTAANASRSRTSSFDAVTFTYLLRYVDDPAATLPSWRGCSGPVARWRTWSSSCRRTRCGGGCGGCTRARPAGRRGGSSSRPWGEVGRFLGPNIRVLPAPSTDDQLAMWRAAGIADVRARPDEPRVGRRRLGDQESPHRGR